MNCEEESGSSRPEKFPVEKYWWTPKRAAARKASSISAGGPVNLKNLS